jgi:hypothetical protein
MSNDPRRDLLDQMLASRLPEIFRPQDDGLTHQVGRLTDLLRQMEIDFAGHKTGVNMRLDATSDRIDECRSFCDARIAESRAAGVRVSDRLRQVGVSIDGVKTGAAGGLTQGVQELRDDLVGVIDAKFGECKTELADAVASNKKLIDDQAIAIKPLLEAGEGVKWMKRGWVGLAYLVGGLFALAGGVAAVVKVGELLGWISTTP